MGLIWRVIEQGRDLGVVKDSFMKISIQCSAVLKKGNFMLGIITKEIQSKKMGIIINVSL